jgi:hypothetical protein
VVKSTMSSADFKTKKREVEMKGITICDYSPEVIMPGTCFHPFVE